MPELPEVETVRRDLEGVLLRKKITDVEVLKQKVVKGTGAKLKRDLVGREIVEVDRKGKLLVFHLDSGKHLLVHLKMTGQLMFRSARKIVGGGHPTDNMAELPNKHTRVMMKFREGELFFNDQRMFGYWRVVNDKQLDEVLGKFGVEPLTKEFTIDFLYDMLKRRSMALKGALLDQTKLAGLGNIYVDEACFVAGVRPMRRANRLTKEEVRRLHREINKVIKKAIEKRGTTFSHFRDGRGKEGNFVKLLKVYGRVGMKCKRCKQADIRKVKVNGRGTSFCPVCQPR